MMFFSFFALLGRSARSESPVSVKRWLRCMMRSKMASAMVASPIQACQCSTGNCNAEFNLTRSPVSGTRHPSHS